MNNKKQLVCFFLFFAYKNYNFLNDLVEKKELF